MTVIETLRALLEKATPAPWAGDGSELRGGKDYQRSMAEFWSDDRDVDVELVCALRNAAPGLLRVAEAMAKLNPDKDRMPGLGCMVCGTHDYEVDENGEPQGPRHAAGCEWVISRVLSTAT